jgi:hypothetical protein
MHERAKEKAIACRSQCLEAPFHQHEDSNPPDILFRPFDLRNVFDVFHFKVRPKRVLRIVLFAGCDFA